MPHTTTRHTTHIWLPQVEDGPGPWGAVERSRGAAGLLARWSDQLGWGLEQGWKGGGDNNICLSCYTRGRHNQLESKLISTNASPTSLANPTPLLFKKSEAYSKNNSKIGKKLFISQPLCLAGIVGRMLTNALQVCSQPGTDLFVLSVCCCVRFLASLFYQEYSCMYHTWGS